ncbi:unnamed protein product [Peronospora belbahrii]|uniref:Isochorismatase-like domain-containing protein n=1 Tax=Peronospora belbahrii TaxID=622444 RepID=A0ABN8CUA0_9STRA|nr:unnamed protein product [Peronospora belbahrii]
MVLTTQYSSRLGTTVSEISNNLENVQNIKMFDKMKFSMLIPEVENHLTNKGYDVHVVSDAVSSSTSYNRSIALERMRQSGAFITSVESAIFQLANDASNPEFKSISKLIKEHLKVENGFDTGVRM